MTMDPVVSKEQRWEVGILIGPCTQREAERFMERVADFVEGLPPKYDETYGAAVSMGPWAEDPA